MAGVGLGVGMGVGTGVGMGVGTGVGIRVGIGVGMGVGVGVGDGVGTAVLCIVLASPVGEIENCRYLSVFVINSCSSKRTSIAKNAANAITRKITTLASNWR